VLFLGVLGALVLRGIFIAGGAVLIERFSGVLYLFAAFLIYTGYRMVRQRDSHLDPGSSRALRLFRRHVPMTDAYHGQRFVIRRDGALLATPLLAVLLLVEVTDVIFAVDSIPAIFAVTGEPFLVFTANAFALLGLRAMYFLLADLMHRFVYLKLGLALVLVWVGVKMLLKVDVYYVPTTVSLAVIATILTVAVVASLRATRGQGRRSLAEPTDPPFRTASADELALVEPLWRRRRAADEHPR
jgi:tellurite resistance protein TerC